MSITQLSVTFQAEQDRILLRVATSDAQEMQLWLTRRLLRGLWPLLARTQAEHGPEAAGATPSSGALPTPEARQMLAEVRREAFLAQADFATPFRESAQRPLGEQPLLATEVSVTPLAQGRLRLGFAERREGHADKRTLELTLEPSLVHGLTHLLEQALAQSQWLLPFAAPAEAAATPAEGDARPRYLN